jgi:hypothetical protein
MRQLQNHLSSLCNRWKNVLVDDVPDDLAICEFDCRKLRCTQGEWVTCDRRITWARGELLPMRNEPRTDTRDIVPARQSDAVATE